MRIILKNIFLTLCFAAYSLSVFSSITVTSFDSDFSNRNHSEGIHLTELSNILFPQAIHADGNGVSIVHVSFAFDSGINKEFIATQALCKLTVQYSINYFKEFTSTTLQFRTEDIIFPFHSFW